MAGKFWNPLPYEIGLGRTIGLHCDDNFRCTPKEKKWPLVNVESAYVPNQKIHAADLREL